MISESHIMKYVEDTFCKHYSTGIFKSEFLPFYNFIEDLGRFGTLFVLATSQFGVQTGILKHHIEEPQDARQKNGGDRQGYFTLQQIVKRPAGNLQWKSTA